MIDFSNFEKIIKVEFGNKDILKQAFTHRSYLNENRKGKVGHNERLEFLGDAVLELAVTKFLYNKYPEKPEGDLTAIRAALVNTNTISNAAKKLKMNDFLLLSKGETKDIGRARQYILANAFEAIIGAIYLDKGFDAAEKFIEKNIFYLTDKIVSKNLWQDSKSYFQEKVQEENGLTPIYKTLKEDGPDHDKHFSVGVFIGEELISEGKGKSKQEAEQEAAEEALKIKGWR
ncbi:ribonuclease III [Patescibacteria group bacterium]|nr:ribonuclease III [Patescibacteria group bacterium]MBU4115914.1 ribonuclease III [Patescibacteria group bacterium]